MFVDFSTGFTLGGEMVKTAGKRHWHATPANKRQIGGTHYKTGGEEHWDRVARLKLDYFQGQITKYVERWKLKGGVQDLEKASHFLDKYIELARLGKLHDFVSPKL